MGIFSFCCHSGTMVNSWIDVGMNLLKDVDWDEVKETAKFYYSDSTTTLDLYPALAITFLVIVLLVPLLGSIPSIDLFPSSGYSSYGQTDSSGYGAPEPSYGAPAPSYGAPSRSSWSQGGEYRSFQNDEGENLKDIYNGSDDWIENSEVRAARTARSIGQASPLNNLLANNVKLIN